MDTPGPSSALPSLEQALPPSGPAPPPAVPAVALTPDEVHRIANEHQGGSVLRSLARLGHISKFCLQI